MSEEKALPATRLHAGLSIFAWASSTGAEASVPKHGLKRNAQAVLQGVPFTRVQVLSSKRLVLLHEKRVRRAANMKQHCAPVCATP